MSDVNSLRKRLVDFYVNIGMSKGEKVVRLLKNLELSFQMSKKNYLDLVAANESYLTDHGIEQPKNVEKLNKFLLDFQRLLFNYLASFVSFLDHVEVFVKEMNSLQLNKEFGALFREKEFVEKRTFAKDLRKYMIYFSLPFPRVETRYLPTPKGVLTDTNPGFCKGELGLRKRELLRWNGFKKGSRDFLSGFYGNVIVLVSSAKFGCVDLCQGAINDLFELLNAKVNEIFHDEIAEFLTLRDKYEENLKCLNLRWKNLK